jgi:hypothetical protein
LTNAFTESALLDAMTEAVLLIESKAEALASKEDFCSMK